MAENRFPILGGGEFYSAAIKVPRGGGPKKPFRTFEEARQRLLPQFEGLLESVKIYRSKDLMLPNKLFFQVSLDFEYLAKSYFPTYLVDLSGWEMVGSRPWQQMIRDESKLQDPKLARMLFFRTDPIRIESTYERLKRSSLEAKEQEDFLKIDNIGIQRTEDRLIGFIDRGMKKTLVELIFHPMGAHEWNACRTRLKTMVSQSKNSEFLWDWKRGDESEPIFLPAVLSEIETRQVGEFNPLRAARPMPSISIPRVRKDKVTAFSQPSMGPILRAVYPEIGVIDGGADTQVPHLRGWVSNTDITPEPTEESFFDHGTAVCGAALYGSCNPGAALDQPKLKVKSFRVFPVLRKQGLDLDLYQVLDWLEDIVQDPKNKGIRVYTLSFGPNIPIEDQEVDRFTATLDRLAYHYDILFSVAAGNDGNLQYPFNRIQPPSDLVNGLGVGAFTLINGVRVNPASYCCLGPGRPGSQIKPDISGFGGSDDHPFYVLLAGTDSEVAEEQGTSYATPRIASLAGHILYRASVPDFVTPQTSKALIIHHARSFEGLDRTRYGWGAIEHHPEALMECQGNEVKVIYNGILDLTRWARLQLPFPDDLNYEGRVDFEWTFVYACDVRIETPDDYTLAGLEVTFRPHFFHFKFTKNKKALFLDDRDDEARRLMGQGWKKSGQPLSKSYVREQQLREKGKWDTVLRGKAFVLRKDLDSPVLDVHALGRGEWEYRGGPGRINYAAVVTVKVNDPGINLYERVRSTMRQLVPISLRVRARIT